MKRNLRCLNQSSTQ